MQNTVAVSTQNNIFDSYDLTFIDFYVFITFLSLDTTQVQVTCFYSLFKNEDL